MTALHHDNDARIMLAFQMGDDNSFEELLTLYKERMVNFIYRQVGRREDAEDLAQEVFLRVYRSRGRYEATAKLSTWIYRIAANICLDHRRKLPGDLLSRAAPTHQTDEDTFVEIPAANEKSPQAIAEEEDSNAAILKALQTLPGQQRIALTLKVYEDRSYAEIAAILAVSVPAVESLIFRARKTLKSRLSPV